MTKEGFIAMVRDGIEAYVCNETKLFKDNQGDYDFAESVVDYLVANGCLPLEEFSEAHGLRREDVMQELNEKIHELELSLLRYRLHADLSRGVLHAQALSSMDGSPAPDAWREIPVIADARPLGHDDHVSLQMLDQAPNICVWMTKRTHLWTIASGFFKVDSY